MLMYNHGSYIYIAILLCNNVWWYVAINVVLNGGLELIIIM